MDKEITIVTIISPSFLLMTAYGLVFHLSLDVRVNLILVLPFDFKTDRKPECKITKKKKKAYSTFECHFITFHRYCTWASIMNTKEVKKTKVFF